jgi:hypothetical protein
MQHFISADTSTPNCHPARRCTDFLLNHFQILSICIILYLRIVLDDDKVGDRAVGQSLLFGISAWMVQRSRCLFSFRQQ